MSQRPPPLWRYFGSKWKLVPKYPKPNHDLIVEPFAGAANYAMTYADRRVVLVEKNPILCAVWRYLIGASEAEVRAIPKVRNLDDLPASLPIEARHLVGFWFGAGDTRPRQRMSSMIARDGGYDPARVAAQLHRIRHWIVIEGDYTQAPDERATWFVDPPYQVAGSRDVRSRGRVRYPFGGDAIDFGALSAWCQARRGQVIVCENEGATWLPFEPLAVSNAAAPGARTLEAMWYRDEVA